MERRAVKRKEKEQQKKYMQNQAVVKNKASLDIPLSIFPDEQYLFWLAHGVNHMVSDYEQGIWRPIFEGIYEGQLFQPAELAQTVMAQYQNLTEWPLEAKAAVAWTVTDRNVVYIYYREALRRLRTSYPEVEDLETLVKQPHQAQVWEMFKFLRDKLLHKKV